MKQTIGVLTHRAEIVEESNTVRRGCLHGELQEGLHVQMRLDYCGGPQKCGDCPCPVNTSCIKKNNFIQFYIYIMIVNGSEVEISSGISVLALKSRVKG